MTRYSIEWRDKIFIKGYGFLSFVKKINKDLSKNFGGKYSLKFLDHAK